MPVQPVVSPEQLVITVAFLMLLLVVLWFVKRNRGGIKSKLRISRRMQLIEEMSLGHQQRHHLVEIDGRVILVHAGKGHAASFLTVDGMPAVTDQAPPASPQKTRPTAPAAAAKSTKPKSAFAAAVAQARRNNPSVEFGK